MPGGQIVRDVKRVGTIRTVIIQETIGNHLGRTGNDLLGRLEHEDDGAGEVGAVRGQQFCRTHEDGGVGIMAAGMHLAWHLRTEALGDLRVGFRQWQGIHVRAQEDRSTRPRTVENADHASLADPGAGLDAEGAQSIGDDSRGPVFLERDLRVAVDIATVGDGARTKYVGFTGDVERVHRR